MRCGGRSQRLAGPCAAPRRAHRCTWGGACPSTCRPCAWSCTCTARPACAAGPAGRHRGGHAGREGQVSRQARQGVGHARPACPGRRRRPGTRAGSPPSCPCLARPPAGCARTSPGAAPPAQPPWPPSPRAAGTAGGRWTEANQRSRTVSDAPRLGRGRLPTHAPRACSCRRHTARAARAGRRRTCTHSMASTSLMGSSARNTALSSRKLAGRRAGAAAGRRG